MAKSLLDHLVVDAGLEEQGGRCMPEGMERKLCQSGGFECCLGVVGDVVRTDGCEVLRWEYQVTGLMIRKAELETEAVGFLLPQHGDGGIINGKGPAGTCGLRALGNDRRLTVTDEAGLIYGDSFAGEVHVLPPKAQYLAAPHAGDHRKTADPEQYRIRDVGEDGLQLLPGERHGLCVRDVGLLHCSQWIHRDDAIQRRLLQRCTGDGMAVGHGTGRQAGCKELFPVHPERHGLKLVQGNGANGRIGDVLHDTGVGLYSLGRHGVSKAFEPCAAPFPQQDVVIHQGKAFIGCHLGIPFADGFSFCLPVEMPLPAINDSSNFIIPVFSPGHGNQPPLLMVQGGNGII